MFFFIYFERVGELFLIVNTIPVFGEDCYCEIILIIIQEEGDIIHAGPQFRNMELQRVQPVKKIQPEFFLPDQFGNVLTGG